MRRAGIARSACFLVAACVASMASAACKKSDVAPDDAGARADAAVKPTALASAEADAAGGAGPATRSVTYAGKYSVVAGKMYVPDQKDWSSVKFKNDEAKLLGDGALTLAVDGSGRVSGGTEDGPLGASVLSGTSDGKALTATIRRKDPSDEGLTGTLVATVAGDAVEGTMKLAEANAAVVREAKLEAKAKK